MRHLANAVALTIASCVAGCAGQAAAPVTGVDAKFNFAYDLPGREQVQLSQVFDDGARTYLQFSPDLQKAPSLMDAAADRPIALVHSGNYWITEGVHAAVRVTLAGKSIRIVKRPGPGEADSRPGVSRLSPATTTAQPPAAVAPTAGQLKEMPAKVKSVSFRLTVPFHHQDARLSEASMAAINRFAASARDATPLVVMGYTGSPHATPQSKALAIARAEVVRGALVRAGMEGSRIRIFYSSVCCAGSSKPSPRERAAFERAEIRPQDSQTAPAQRAASN